MLKTALYLMCCLCFAWVHVSGGLYCSPFFSGGGVPEVWRHELSMGRLGKGGRKKESHRHPSLSSANVKLHFCALVLEPDTN